MFQKSCIFILMITIVRSAVESPHIIFIVADDLGWNDVSFHGSDQIWTSNIDALAYSGVILNSHYVMPSCTPSRAALLTGRYPIHIGMQGESMHAPEPLGLPLSEKILPQYFKELGYITRAVGKWHLGFYKREYTPTNRGFDSHLGYWTGCTSYYDHINQEISPDGHILNGYDFRRNTSTAWDLEGLYATDVFTNETVNIIQSHPTNKSLFLYLSHLAVHAANIGKRLEAPQQMINEFRHIIDPNRRTYAAMVAKLDESVGQIVAALQKKNMLENSIIVFISDNGAPSVGDYQNWGSNYPLRGAKETLWEGAIRGTAAVWSPLIQRPHRASNELFHITDWLPTLYRAAGGNISDIQADLDGVDQYDAIFGNTTSSREKILLNIDEALQMAAVREGDWKLTVGRRDEDGVRDGYSGFHGTKAPTTENYVSVVTESLVWKAIDNKQVNDEQITSLRSEATITCTFEGGNQTSDCNPSAHDMCLFNITADPCETRNLLNVFEEVARRLYQDVATERRGLEPELRKLWDIVGSDPTKFNHTWSSWLD